MPNPQNTEIRNREDWLRAVADLMAPWFTEHGYSMPTVRMAIGFPSTGKRGKRIGECWDASASADETFEIFIRPDQSDPIEVAAIVAHELCHAVVGLDAGHGPKFRKIALLIGLEGKMTATRPGKRFIENLTPILARVGALPHARLEGVESTGPKKQTTRMLKAECETCGYTVRVTRVWALIGPPRCADESHGPMTVHGLEDTPGPETGEPENRGS